MSGGADVAKFTIDTATGALSFVSAPNFESPTDVRANKVYDVNVQVSDGAGGTDTQTISVTVTDFDEFDVTVPTHADAVPNTVNENIANGTAVGITALASDAYGTNNTSTYSLTHSAGGRFTIDGVTGVVTVANSSLRCWITQTSALPLVDNDDESLSELIDRVRKPN